MQNDSHKLDHGQSERLPSQATLTLSSLSRALDILCGQGTAIELSHSILKLSTQQNGIPERASDRYNAEINTYLTQYNLRAYFGEFNIHDLVTQAKEGAAYLIPSGQAWIVIKDRQGSLVNPQGEQEISLKPKILTELCGQALVSALYFELNCNLESLGTAPQTQISSQISQLVASTQTGGIRTPSPQVISPTRQAWKRLWALLDLEGTIIRSLVIYSITLGALSLALPVAVQVLVNTIAMGSLMQPLVILSVMLLLVLGLSGCVYLAEHYAVELLQRRLFVRVTEDFSRRFYHLNEQGLSKLKKANLMNRFFEIVTLQKSANKLLMDGLSLILQATVGMILLGFYHPMLLAFDLVLIVSFSLILLLGKGAVKTAVAESEAKYEIAGFLERLGAQVDSQKLGSDQASLSAGPLEQSNSNTKPLAEIDRLTRHYLLTRQSHYRVLLRQLIGGVGIQVIALVSLLGLGGWLVMKGELTLGQLVAAELIVGSLGMSFVKLGKILESTYDMLASVDKLGKVIDLPKLESSRSTYVPPSNLPNTGSLQLIKRTTLRLEVFALVMALILAFSPWQQSVRGDGRVIAYAPLDRQQSIEAPIEGRVTEWHVQEGDEVKEGDLIASISDNDPNILDRLSRERNAAQAQVDAARLSISLTEARIDSEKRARVAAISNAKLKVSMATDRKLAAERSVDAAQATKKTARLNLRRVKSLSKKGLTSKRKLELAELESQKANTDLDRAKAKLRAATAEIASMTAERNKLKDSTEASITSIRSTLEKLKADQAKAEAELAKVEVRLARQNQMQVFAPRAGTILRLLAKQGTEMVKSGDPLVILVPSTKTRAVEMYVDGNDAPLIDRGREVRLQFEGWPAVQFVGWPSVAVGTFGGVVDFIDSHGDEKGRFRVVIRPKENETWPEGRYLKQGVRASGWVLLNEVRLAYEFWRQFNGFPPSLLEDQQDSQQAIKSKLGKGKAK